MDVVTGFDAQDPYAREALPGRPARTTFRFGVPQDGQLEFFGDNQMRLVFDRIPDEVIAPDHQCVLLEVLAWYKKNHPLWFAWLEPRAVLLAFCLPFVVITVYAQLKGFDAHLIEAAQDLGASERAVFWHIILPLLVPSVAASWLLSFTLSLDDVIISSFVTGPQYEVLPIRVFSMVKVGVSPEVNVLAALLLLISMVCLAVFAWFMKRKPKL